MAVVYQFPRSNRIMRNTTDDERVKVIVEKVVALFVACVESVMDDLAADEIDDEAVK